jgi:DNA-binding MarR family transcriptional regulator
MAFVLGETVTITPHQLEVLSLISSRDRWSVGELASALSVSSAATTKTIARLEHKGMVKRSENVMDRRSVNISITMTGREAIHATHGQVL